MFWSSAHSSFCVARKPHISVVLRICLLWTGLPVTPTAPKHGRWRSLEPGEWVASKPRQHAAPHECHRRQRKHADEDDGPQRLKLRMPGDHDERVGAGWGMDSPGQQHESEREDLGQRIDPQGLAETLIADDADQGSTEVATEKRTRLRGRSACQAEEEDGGATNRGKQERRSRRRDEPQGQRDCGGGAGEAPSEADGGMSRHWGSEASDVGGSTAQGRVLTQQSVAGRCGGALAECKKRTMTGLLLLEAGMPAADEEWQDSCVRRRRLLSSRGQVRSIDRPTCLLL